MAYRSHVRRGCYGQAPSTRPVRKYLGQLGPRPTERVALLNWLFGVMLAPDAPIEMRNAACIERRALTKVEA